MPKKHLQQNIELGKPDLSAHNNLELSLMAIDDPIDMEIDNSGSNNEYSSDDDVPEKKRETLISTYLSEKEKQFVPYEFDEETNSVDMVINKRDQDNPADATKWYSSTSIKYLKEINKPHAEILGAIAPFYNKQFWIESAVAGGRCYRLLLGKTQPKMHAGDGAAYSELAGATRTYRLSKEVPNFELWLSISNRDRNQFFGQKPIFDLTALFLIAYFLGDLDLNPGNYGVKEFNDYWQAIKIDPECCFSYSFYTGNKDNILNFILNLHQKIPSGLFNKQELFETLGRIISTPLSSYEEIFGNSFSERYGKQKEIYLAAMAKRINLFTEAAFVIPGFKEYYEARDSYCRYKKLERNFELNVPQQVANQQLLGQLCEHTSPNVSIASNPFSFYQANRETPVTEGTFYTPRQIFPTFIEK